MTEARCRGGAELVALALLSISTLAACGGGGGGGGGGGAPTLTVSKGGYGDGIIASSTPGLTCDALGCTLQSADRPSVTLTVTPSASSTFEGWGQDCTGATRCVVTLDANRSVTATFDPVTTGEDAWHEQNVGRGAVDLARYVAFDTTAAGAGAFPLVASGAAASLIVNTAADGEYPGVVRAVGDLAKDVELVTTQTPTVASATAGAGGLQVIIGTLGHSKLVDGLVAAGKLDEARGIQGKWETWVTKVVDAPGIAGVTQALVIAGSDQRGTIFGVYDLSRNIGVSPWYFWDDVTPAPQTALYVKAGLHTLGQPVVKYRGFFINDEAPALTTWWGNYGKTGTFNAAFYKNVFELALRLRANVVWPAVWGKAFDLDDPQNHATAKLYGIVMGASHEAPMDRGIEEWNRQYRSYGGTNPDKDWSYSTDPTGVRAYWADGIKRMTTNQFEDIVTVGMRGNGDLSSADDKLPDVQAFPLKQQVIADERRIIAAQTGEDASQQPQNWILYSEVQRYWDDDLRPPSDVTVTFCDDDFGSMRALPKLDDAPRSGGYGLYYHVDFTGPYRSYMWVDTNLIANLWEQLNQAYTYGVDRIWVVNSGDVKGNERPTQFFLDLAWNPSNWTADTLSQWQRAYAAQSFPAVKGQDHAQEIADILHAYERLQSRRKPEALNLATASPLSTTALATPSLGVGSPFSLVNYGEFERVLGEWKALRTKAEALNASLDASQQSAYFQVVLYAIQGTENAYELRLAQFKSLMFTFQGRASAADWAATANQRFADDKALQTTYDGISGGKWKGFQAQQKFGFTDYRGPQPGAADSIQPALLGAVIVQSGQSWGFTVEGTRSWWGKGPASKYGDPASPNLGDDPTTKTAPVLPEMSPYLTAPAPYIEVFNRGTDAVTYTITSDDPAVTVDAPSGTLDVGTRKEVRATVGVDWAHVDWSKATGGKKTVLFTITGGDGWATPDGAKVQLPLFNPASAPPDDVFVEASGYVSIEAMHARVVNKAPITWALIPDIGRTESGYTPFPQTAAAQTPGGDSARLEYDVQLYDATRPVTVWVYASPRNNVLGTRPADGSGLRYAVSFDDKAPTTVNITQQTGAKDYGWPIGTVFYNVSGWQRNAADNVAPSYSTHTIDAAGRHTLKLWMVDPTVIVQKILIDTGGLRPSYLGPPESWNASLAR